MQFDRVGVAGSTRSPRTAPPVGSEGVVGSSGDDADHEPGPKPQPVLAVGRSPTRPAVDPSAGVKYRSAVNGTHPSALHQPVTLRIAPAGNGQARGVLHAEDVGKLPTSETDSERLLSPRRTSRP